MGVELLLQNLNIGIQNVENSESIPPEALQDANNFINVKDFLQFSGDKKAFVTGIANIINSMYVMNNGKSDNNFIFVKNGTKITYIKFLNTDNVVGTPVDFITGLDEQSVTYYAEYTSLAGRFLFIFDSQKIFRVCLNNTILTYQDFTNIYDATFPIPWGVPFIDKGRMYIGGSKYSDNLLFVSKVEYQFVKTASIQSQGSYTQITNFSLGNTTGNSITGTLPNNAVTTFRLMIIIGTGTPPPEVITDDGYGNLISNLNNRPVGTINYTTKQYTFNPVTKTTGLTIVANYLIEPFPRILDFSFNATDRVAGEGILIDQSRGTGKIKQIIDGLDGNYYSLKNDIIYNYTPDLQNDTAPTNIIFRSAIGIKNNTSCVATSKGVMIIDTYIADRPIIKILKRNITGSDIIPEVFSKQFYIWDYNFDNAIIKAWSRYVIISCADKLSTYNNVMLLVDIENQRVERLDYPSAGISILGDQVFNLNPITNEIEIILDNDNQFLRYGFFVTRDEKFESENLKVFRKLILYYKNAGNNNATISISYDKNKHIKIGDVNLSNSAISQPAQIGVNVIGVNPVGGGVKAIDNLGDINTLTILVPKRKFRIVNVKIECNGTGELYIYGLKYSQIRKRNLDIPYSER